MPEVAGAGQAEVTVRKHRFDLTEIDLASRDHMGAIGTEPVSDEATDHGQDRNDRQRLSPAKAANRIYEMRYRRAQGYRAEHHSEGKAPTGLEPRRRRRGSRPVGALPSE